MKKLSLDMNDLDVEQFPVASASTRTPGTVRGAEISSDESNPCYCDPMPITWTCE